MANNVLTVALTNFDQTPAAGFRVEIELIRAGLATSSVAVPSRQQQLTPSSGIVTFLCWVNDANSQYRARIFNERGAQVVDGYFKMPNAPTNLADVLVFADSGPISAAQQVINTCAAYAADAAASAAASAAAIPHVYGPQSGGFPSGENGPAVWFSTTASGYPDDIIFRVPGAVPLPCTATGGSLTTVAATINGSIISTTLSGSGIDIASAIMSAAPSTTTTEWLVLLPDLSGVNSPIESGTLAIIGPDLGAALADTGAFVNVGYTSAAGLQVVTFPSNTTATPDSAYTAGQPVMLIMHASGQLDLITPNGTFTNVTSFPSESNVYGVLELVAAGGSHTVAMTMSTDPTNTGGLTPPSGSQPLQ